jgi:hypothetical protein
MTEKAKGNEQIGSPSQLSTKSNKSRTSNTSSISTKKSQGPQQRESLFEWLSRDSSDPQLDTILNSHPTQQEQTNIDYSSEGSSGLSSGTNSFNSKSSGNTMSTDNNKEIGTSNANADSLSPQNPNDDSNFVDQASCSPSSSVKDTIKSAVSFVQTSLSPKTTNKKNDDNVGNENDNKQDSKPMSPLSTISGVNTSPSSFSNQKSTLTSKPSPSSGKPPLPLPPLNQSLALSKKKSNPPVQKITSIGIQNPYNTIGDDDDDNVSAGEEASSVGSNSTNNSDAKGYLPPIFTSSTVTKTTFRPPSPVDLDDEMEDDNLSQRTPIPTGPPPIHATGLASDFLRNPTIRSSSNDDNSSSISDLSEEESSIVKRQKREELNLGRLVVAAKQQHSFAQAWFAAATSAKMNLMPELQPRKDRIPSNAPPNLNTKTVNMSRKQTPGGAGPIDLDSGEEWGGEDKKNVAGSFSYSMAGNRNSKDDYYCFHCGPTPDEEDSDKDKRWPQKICCIVCNLRCNVIVSILIAILILGGIGGGFAASILVKSDKNSSIGAVVNPTSAPSTVPSFQPSSSSRPSSSPSLRPTSKPSSAPTSKPSSSPSSQPSSQPSSVPSSTPTISHQPSSAPSSAPTQYFVSTEYEPIGQNIIPASAPLGSLVGFSVALSDDGTILALGSINYPQKNTGSISMYKLSSSSSSNNRNTGDAVWEPFGNGGNGNVIPGLAVTSSYQNAGYSVSLSSDGKIVAVTDRQYSSIGAVRMFKYIDASDAWELMGQRIDGTKINEKFGSSVSLSGDGLRVVIGSPDFGLTNSGRVSFYQYDVNLNQWITYGNPIDSNILFGNFGYSVSMSKDGMRVVASTMKGTLNGNFVRVYEYSTITNSWLLIGAINCFQYDDNTKKCADVEFGYSTSISDDGKRIAIGVPGMTVNKNTSSGMVAIYRYIDAASGWKQMGSSIVNTPFPNQRLGVSVSMNDTGKRVAVGSSAKGEVTVLEWNGEDWVPSKVLKGGMNQSSFGHSLSLSSNGDYLAVGDPATANSFSQTGECNAFKFVP